jgi:hypothetical protein
MLECDGCPGYQRRIELYSNRDTGCGLEFYVEPKVTPKPTPTPEPTPTPTPSKPGGEDSSNSLVATTIFAVLSTILFNNY